MITANGIGSGLDIDSIVTQLMAIEREPVNRLESQRAALDVELSAYGSVRSAMSTLGSDLGTLGDRSRIGPFVSTSSDETVATATASGTAAAATHQIDVQSLAAAHRVASIAYDSADEGIGAGDWSFTSGDTAFSVELAVGEDSLTALRDAINDHADNDAITASLLTTDDGTRLVLSARNSGTEHQIDASRTVSTGGLFGGTEVTDPFEEVTAASDARVLIDGFEVTSDGNTVSGAIEGLDIELVAAGTATLTTRRDLEALDDSLAAFVTNYNTLVGDLRRLGEDTLQGDRLPRNAESAFRQAFGADIELADGTRFSPFELGFTFDRYGTLSLDAARRSDGQQSLERYVDAFTQADTGFAARMNGVLETFTGAGGRLDTRDDGVERRRNSLDNQIERFEYRLEQTETRYLRQFAAMDALVGQLQSTSSFLTSRLSQSGITS